MSDHLLVITTVPDGAVGDALATRLVDRGLAACVNIGATVTSIYKWQGQIERDGEVMLTIKTTKQRFDELARAIRDGHPYELPELIALPIVDGSDDYLAWIDECTRS